MATNSGYTKIFDDKNRGPLLIIIGVLLVAFSMGHLEFGDSIKFVPSQEVSDITLYVATAIGAFLVLTGIALILHQREILQPLLRKFFYVIISTAIITLAGIAVGMRIFPKEKPDIIQCYTVNQTSFQIYVSFWKIREYTRNSQDKVLVVVYRRPDPSLLFEEDPFINMKRVIIGKKDMEMLRIPFSAEFSRSLRPEADMVEFALWLCPKHIRLADVTTTFDLEKQGGELLETASATVQKHNRWSGRHCPQFFQGITIDGF